MLEYLTIRKYKHTKHLINLWNSEFRSTYPIKKQLYRDVVLNDVHLNKDASFVALYDNEPVGFIFIKTWIDESGLADEHETAHISLIFVKKEMRNMGIGSDMLKLALSEIKKYHNIKTLVVGNEMNRLFSGVPSELSGAPIFFVNKDFIQKEAVVDMIQVAKNKEVEDLIESDLKISVATEEEKDEILQLCVNNGWKREAYLINQYYENGGTGRRIAIGRIEGKIVAFVRFNDENKAPLKLIAFIKRTELGTINFVRIDKNYQDRNYEEVMNVAARHYLAKRGCKKIIVLATKDIKFYKNLGYSAYKYYLQFELDL